MAGIQKNSLLIALSKMLGATITDAEYTAEVLQGGTLGDVRLVTGVASADDGRQLPYRIVFKTQKKWERYGDPNSWRREYDLYLTDLDRAFSDFFRWPMCYHAELDDDEMRIWIEYISGVSGLDLTADMYVYAAEQLGRFQGRLFATQPDVLPEMTNLSTVGFVKQFYEHYRSWDEVYAYIRSDDCEIPAHLCQMIIDIDVNSDAIWQRIEKLPVVLCHRDFWVANIFYADGGIVLLDWDTTGWGYLGEDIASLIADEADTAHMLAYYRRCVPAYYKGFSEYVDVSHITDDCIYEMILMLFGYRLVEWYKFANSLDEKVQHLATLQKIYEMRPSKR